MSCPESAELEGWSRLPNALWFNILSWYFSTSLFKTSSGYIRPLAFLMPYFWNTADTTKCSGITNL